MKAKAISENICSGPTATARMLKSAQWLRDNREQQIEAGIHEFKTAKPGLLTYRKPLEEVRYRIKDAAHTIRSWHAWGEPSEYGKAVCARLREEIICYARIKRAIENQTT